MKLNDIRDFCITVRLLRTGDMSCNEIIQSELERLLDLSKIMAVSDMLPHNFIYKPMIFNQLKLENEKEYKVFKKLKVADYIEVKLLEKKANGRDLISGLLDGELIVNGNMLASRGNDFRYNARNIMDSYTERPIKTRISEGTLLDIYVSTTDEIQNCIKDDKNDIQLSGLYMCIEQIEPVIQRKTNYYAIQSKSYVSESTVINEGTESMFRVAYNANSGQFFIPGSTFYLTDSLNCRKHIYQPFKLYIGDI